MLLLGPLSLTSPIWILVICTLTRREIEAASVSHLSSSPARDVGARDIVEEQLRDTAASSRQPQTPPQREHESTQRPSRFLLPDLNAKPIEQEEPSSSRTKGKALIQDPRQPVAAASHEAVPNKQTASSSIWFTRYPIFLPPSAPIHPRVPPELAAAAAAAATASASTRPIEYIEGLRFFQTGSGSRVYHHHHQSQEALATSSSKRKPRRDRRPFLERIPPTDEDVRRGHEVWQQIHKLVLEGKLKTHRLPVKTRKGMTRAAHQVYASLVDRFWRESGGPKRAAEARKERQRVIAAQKQTGNAASCSTPLQESPSDAEKIRKKMFHSNVKRIRDKLRRAEGAVNWQHHWKPEDEALLAQLVRDDPAHLAVTNLQDRLETVRARIEEVERLKKEAKERAAFEAAGSGSDSVNQREGGQGN